MVCQEKYKLLVLDVDGTLTDGKIYMSDGGEIFKAFDVKDGYAIKNMIPQTGLKVAIITGKKSEIVRRRAEELNISLVFQNINNKIECLKDILESEGYTLDEVVYVGDDLNDLECMEKVGLACCPADACEQIKKVADYISKYEGGKGAVRQIIEHIIEEKFS